MSEKPTKEQLEDVINKCTDLDNESMYPGMTYEQGVKAAIDWMTGNYGEMGESPLD